MHTDTMKDQVIINGIEYVPKVIAPEPVKVGRWKPENGERFWFLTGIGDTNIDTWHGFDGDSMRYSLGNIYQTEALATLARDKQLLMVELQDFADRVNEGIEVKRYWYLDFDISEGLSFQWGHTQVQGAINFSRSAGIGAAIEHFGDRLNLLK